MTHDRAAARQQRTAHVGTRPPQAQAAPHGTKPLRAMDESTFHWRVKASWLEAEESLRQIAPNARISSGADLRHELQADGDDRFTLLRFQLAGELEAINDSDGTITITAVSAGWMHWAVGEERGTAAQPWVQSTDQPALVRFGALDDLVLFLKKGPLQHFARAFYGDDDIRLDFDGPLPVDPQHGQFFASALDHAHTVASSPAFEEPVLRAGLYRHLAIALLEGYRLSGDRRARTITAEGRLRRYRTASRYLDEHASLPITIEDAARHVGTSTTDLEQIFRGHSTHAEDARSYLRRTRLSAAHTDLINGDPTLGDTVANIAHRWGYPSPSTFAKHYRATYGTNPRWVLNQ